MKREKEGEPRPLRWGIMGAARIARRRLAPAIAATGGRIVAVAASDGARAKEFAEALGIPRAYEGYSRLLEDEEVEAVYVPLANGLHFEWAVKTAESGRPCLCEKPMALSAREAGGIAKAFATAGCVVQEAFMWRHHVQIAAAVDQIQAGAIGAIKQVNATFSFTLDRPEDYRWKADQGGGALWDIGTYCVNAARYFFCGEPIAASARSVRTGGVDSVDATTAGWLDFGEGRLATISCSFCSAFSQGLELVGAEGRMWLGQPWGAPDRSSRLHIERDGERKEHEFEPMNAYEAMVRHFTGVVREPGRPMAPAENGLAQAVAMDGLQSSARNGGAVWNAPSAT